MISWKIFHFWCEYIEVQHLNRFIIHFIFLFIFAMAMQIGNKQLKLQTFDEEKKLLLALGPYLLFWRLFWIDFSSNRKMYFIFPIEMNLIKKIHVQVQMFIEQMFWKWYGLWYIFVLFNQYHILFIKFRF